MPERTELQSKNSESVVKVRSLDGVAADLKLAMESKRCRDGRRIDLKSNVVLTLVCCCCCSCFCCCFLAHDEKNNRKMHSNATAITKRNSMVEKTYCPVICWNTSLVAK